MVFYEYQKQKMLKFNFPTYPLFLFALLFFFCTSLNGQGYTIKQYNVELNLNKNGSYDIRENIDVVFNEKRRGIMIDVPRSFNHNNKTYKTQLTNLNTGIDPSTILKKGNNNTIRIGNKDVYLTGDKSYSISYNVQNTVLDLESHLEFQYNIISDWDAPIENVNYTITLPPDVNLGFKDFGIITGESGADERNASIAQSENILKGKSFAPLKPYENITLAIKLPAGSIEAAKPVPPPIPIYEKDKLWAIPLGILGLIIGFFFKSKKEDDSYAVKEETHPPQAFCPAEVGTFYDGYVHTRDVISLLPYWAEQGYITVENNNLEGKLNDLYFIKKKNLPQGTPFYQTVLFDNIFKESDVSLLSEMKNEIYSSYYKSAAAIKKNLKQKELYDEEHYKLFHSGKMIAAFFIFLLSGIFLATTTQYTISAIIIMALGVVCLIIHFIKPKRSERGIRIHNHLKGLKAFLENTDGEKTMKILKDDPQYFEKIYPYVMAFGIDKSWVEKMTPYDIQAPYWYGIHNDANSMRPSFNSFSENFNVPEIKSVFTSAPASQSGGSGGGGFSGGSAGGGFGGGGRSW